MFTILHHSLQEEENENLEDRRPTYINKELFCHGCKAFVSETLKALRGKKSEDDVYKVLGTICREANFDNYPRKYRS